MRPTPTEKMNSSKARLWLDLNSEHKEPEGMLEKHLVHLVVEITKKKKKNKKKKIVTVVYFGTQGQQL